MKWEEVSFIFLQNNLHWLRRVFCILSKSCTKRPLKMFKGSALNLTDVFLWKFSASWNLLSCRAVFSSGNRKNQLAFTILQFARKYIAVIAECAAELLCKRNQPPFLQITTSMGKFASFTFPAPVCRYTCLLCIHRPQTVCRVCLSPLPLQNYQDCFVFSVCNKTLGPGWFVSVPHAMTVLLLNDWRHSCLLKLNIRAIVTCLMAFSLHLQSGCMKRDHEMLCVLY